MTDELSSPAPNLWGRDDDEEIGYQYDSAEVERARTRRRVTVLSGLMLALLAAACAAAIWSMFVLKQDGTDEIRVQRKTVTDSLFNLTQTVDVASISGSFLARAVGPGLASVALVLLVPMVWWQLCVTGAERDCGAPLQNHWAGRVMVGARVEAGIIHALALPYRSLRDLGEVYGGRWAGWLLRPWALAWTAQWVLLLLSPGGIRSVALQSDSASRGDLVSANNYAVVIAGLEAFTALLMVAIIADLTLCLRARLAEDPESET